MLHPHSNLVNPELLSSSLFLFFVFISNSYSYNIPPPPWPQCFFSFVFAVIFPTLPLCPYLPCLLLFFDLLPSFISSRLFWQE